MTYRLEQIEKLQIKDKLPNKYNFITLINNVNKNNSMWVVLWYCTTTLQIPNSAHKLLAYARELPSKQYK